jgi:hypothetical protein
MRHRTPIAGRRRGERLYRLRSVRWPTYYYFVDLVGDIDNDEGEALLQVVVLAADHGLPTTTSLLSRWRMIPDNYLAHLEAWMPRFSIDDNP